MKASKENIKILMLALHKKIEEYANALANSLNNGNAEKSMFYPPNYGLTTEEIESLKKLKDDLILKSALRKLFADNSAGVLFDLMNLIDRTSDPNLSLGNWTGLSFVDSSEEIEENSEMLHDTFVATYWDWKKIRPKKDWKLDNVDD